MIVGFTGSRLGMSDWQRHHLRVELHRAGATQLHHGDCIGSDKQAHEIGRQLGLKVVGHPPSADGLRAFCDCDELRPMEPYLVRNRSIVLESELVIGAPDAPPVRRSGTWNTIRLAVRMHVPVIVLPRGPDMTERYTMSGTAIAA